MTKQILTIYYSWSGHTKALAEQIHQLAGGDLVALTVPSNTFSSDMYQTSDQAKAQLASNQLPKLTNALPAFDDYDVVLVGGPVWSGAPATPILTLLQSLQSTSAVIAPFYTHAGTAGSYEQAFIKAAPKLTVVDGLGVSGYASSNATTQIYQWLNQI
jgi:flavodoxin